MTDNPPIPVADLWNFGWGFPPAALADLLPEERLFDMEKSVLVHRGLFQTAQHILSRIPEAGTAPSGMRNSFSIAYTQHTPFVYIVSRNLIFINKLGLSFWKWVCYNRMRIVMPL